MNRVRAIISAAFAVATITSAGTRLIAADAHVLTLISGFGRNYGDSLWRFLKGSRQRTPS